MEKRVRATTIAPANIPKPGGLVLPASPHPNARVRVLPLDLRPPARTKPRAPRAGAASRAWLAFGAVLAIAAGISLAIVVVVTR